MDEKADHWQTGSLSNGSSELLELIERLPEHERLVIALKHFEGYTALEIANITSQSVGTVTKQLTRARRRLHDWLTQETESHD